MARPWQEEINRKDSRLKASRLPLEMTVTSKKDPEPADQSVRFRKLR